MVTKILMVHVGGSFRWGGTLSMNIGAPEGYDGQKQACESHVLFADNIRKKWNIATDFLIDTYTTQYDSDIQSWYPEGSQFVFHNPFKSYELLLKDAIDRVSNLKQYDAVLFVRVDLLLLPDLFETFHPFKKITFTHLGGNDCLLSNKRPSVMDLILWVPSRFYSIFSHTCLEWFPEGTIRLFHDAYNYYSASATGFWIDNPYHRSLKETLAVNPFQVIVNRPRNPLENLYQGDLADFKGILEDDMTYPKLDINHCPVRTFDPVEVPDGRTWGKPKVSPGTQSQPEGVAAEAQTPTDHIDSIEGAQRDGDLEESAAEAQSFSPNQISKLINAITLIAFVFLIS